MKFSIDTDRGKYKYRFIPVYNGIKMIDRAIARENLLLFKEIAARHGFRFGLAYGTLLGALREGDFIPHDEDIDLFAYREQLDTFKNMLWDLRESGFDLIRMDRTEAYASIMRKGEYIDFYFFRPFIDGYHESYGYVLPASFLTELACVEFLGTEFPAPKDAEDAMLFLYGENWRTPVQYNDYGMGFLQKTIVLIRWHLYYTLPKPLCLKYLKKRLPIKMENANRRIDNFNRLKGAPVLKRIPVDATEHFKF